MIVYPSTTQVCSRNGISALIRALHIYRLSSFFAQYPVCANNNFAVMNIHSIDRVFHGFINWQQASLRRQYIELSRQARVSSRRIAYNQKSGTCERGFMYIPALTASILTFSGCCSAIVASAPFIYSNLCCLSCKNITAHFSAKIFTNKLSLRRISVFKL